MSEPTRLSRVDNGLLLRVNEVLHYLWDPIGVSDIPEARDEYDSYAGVVFSLIKRGAAEKEIAEYLRNTRVVHMGMRQKDERGNEEEIAETLISWKETNLQRIGTSSSDVGRCPRKTIAELPASLL